MFSTLIIFFIDLAYECNSKNIFYQFLKRFEHGIELFQITVIFFPKTMYVSYLCFPV